jgi:hypothetical protein
MSEHPVVRMTGAGRITRSAAADEAREEACVAGWQGVVERLIAGVSEAGVPEDTALAPLRRPALRIAHDILGFAAPAGDRSQIAKSVVAAVFSRWVDLLAFTGRLLYTGTSSRPSEQWRLVLSSNAEVARAMAIRLLLAARAARNILVHRGAMAKQLEAVFGVAPGDPVGDLTVGLGDAHYAGATVTRVHFHSGRTIICKPRPGSSARWFKCVHDTVAAAIPDRLQLRFARMLDGGDHVWEEDMVAAPCRTGEEVRLFYERAGLLLALCRLCRSTDLHGENVLACGSHPVPIDIEALASPARHGAARYDPGYDLWFAPTDVEELTVLPHDVRTRDGAFRRESSFASRGVDSEQTVCAPQFEGRDVPVEDFAETLIAGFRLASEAIWARQLGVGWADILSGVRQAQPRILLRPTQFYASLGRDVFGEFVDRSGKAIEAELVRCLSASSTSKESGAIARAEARSMLLGDVPTFLLCPGTLDRLNLVPVAAALPGPHATLCDPRDFSPPAIGQEIHLIRRSLLPGAR